MTKHICLYSGIEFETIDIGSELKAVEDKLAKCVSFIDYVADQLCESCVPIFRSEARELLKELGEDEKS